MCQGKDPAPVESKNKEPKTIGHGKTLPPSTKDLDTILTYFMHMAERVAKRLRHHGYTSRLFAVKMRLSDAPSIKAKLQVAEETNDGRTIYKAIHAWARGAWRGEGVRLVQITALDLHPEFLQQSLIERVDSNRSCLNKAIDTINQKYGEFSIAPVRLANRSKMNNVIAPSWRPDSPRQTILD